MRLLRPFIVVVLVLLAACQPTASISSAVDVSQAVHFQLSSPNFQDTGMIPKVYSCQGDNLSPELAWSLIPANTRSFVLIVEDPDAPGGTFTHWVLYDIPARAAKLPEGAKQLGVSGLNGLKQSGYMGPCPPNGLHRYYFRLYAVDEASLGLPAGASRNQVEAALKGHVVGVADIMGRYEQQ